MRIGIPALAGLSAMHGLVPPHPGPLIAIAALKANLGMTLALGVLLAIPTVIIAGPLFSKFAARWVDVDAPATFMTERETALVGAGAGVGAGVGVGAGGSGRLTDSTTGATTTGSGVGGTDDFGAGPVGRRPSFGVTLATVLLPVVLMMGKALVDIFSTKGDALYTVLDFIGTPLIALLIAVIVAMFTFGRGSGMDLRGVAGSLEKSLPPIAGILLIVAAGGGFKQTLIDTGIGQVISNAVKGSSLSVLLLAWLVAVLIRVATGSATVATVTASGVLAPLAVRAEHQPRLPDGAGDRLRVAVLLARERRGLLARQGVLRRERRAEPEDLVCHGDAAVRHRAGPGHGRRRRRLIPVNPGVPRSAARRPGHSHVRGRARQPGGQPMFRPPSTWKCTWSTDWPACGPVLVTRR